MKFSLVFLCKATVRRVLFLHHLGPVCSDIDRSENLCGASASVSGSGTKGLSGDHVARIVQRRALLAGFQGDWRGFACQTSSTTYRCGSRLDPSSTDRKISSCLTRTDTGCW
ncbi:hypothetical protein FD951_12135 [Pseudomonas chlororaphis subsp. aurantiaca]|nr:hypothetical protein FD951_12135 [Pseudomonas chlororaphis subsp. aurantiaca]